jgi:hypothetical protein
MTSAFRRWRLAVTAVVAVWLATMPVAAQAPSLRQLHGVDEMKSWFNANREHPRVIFLLSPT